MYEHTHFMGYFVCFFADSGGFSVIWLESGKICKNKYHTCLFDGINICQVPLKMFEQLLWDQVNVKVWKTFVVPIVVDIH